MTTIADKLASRSSSISRSTSTTSTTSSEKTLDSKDSSIDSSKALPDDTKTTDPVISYVSPSLFTPTVETDRTGVSLVSTSVKVPVTKETTQSILSKVSIDGKQAATEKGFSFATKTAAIPGAAKATTVTSAVTGGSTFTAEDGDIEIDFDPLPGEYYVPAARPFPWLLVGGLALVIYFATRK